MNDEEIIKLMNQFISQPPWMRVNNTLDRWDVNKFRDAIIKAVAIWEDDYRNKYGCLPEEKAQFTAFHDGGCTNLGKE